MGVGVPPWLSHVEILIGRYGRDSRIFFCRFHEIGINGRERAGRAVSDLTPAYISPFISARGAYRLFSALLPYPVSRGGNDGGAGIKETNPVCETI